MGTDLFSLSDFNFTDYCARQRTCFVANEGNAGDGVIALGMRHWMEKNALQHIPVLRSDDPAIQYYEAVIFGGGGNLIPAYSTGFDFIRSAYDQGRNIVVLPHTIAGRMIEWQRMSDRITLFCREKVSYYALINNGFPSAKIGLDHDMAFQIPQRFFENTNRADCSTAHCFRGDEEQNLKRRLLSRDNRDISLSWNGALWHNAELCRSSSEGFVHYLSQYRRVETDRLHVAIVAARMGLETNLYSGSYYKNRAVYEFSLKDHYPNVSYLEWS